MDYSIFHVEKYRHGKIEKNDLDGSKKVTIADHVGYYDVYECESTKKRKRLIGKIQKRLKPSKSR